MIPLVNHLLESTIFAGVMGLLTLALRRNRAYSLWMAFSLLVTLPLLLTPPAASPGRLNWLRNAAWALWLFGSAAILIQWRVRWQKIAATLHAAAPVPDVVAQAFARAASPMLGTHDLLPENSPQLVDSVHWFFGCQSRAKTEARSHECERCTHECVRHEAQLCRSNRFSDSTDLPGKKLLLALLIIVAVAGPIHAQSQLQTAAPLSFDVASVKPVAQPWLQVVPQRSGGRITWTTDLHYLVGYAYRLQDWRISGPLPGSDYIYAIDAATAPAATEDQIRLMFQSLLADRFKMIAHRVTKDVEGYALTVGKSGPKIKEAKAEDNPAPLPEWFQKQGDTAATLEGKVVATIPKAGVVAVTGRRVSMLQLTETLQRVLHVSVLDQTGLPGNYYFAFEFAQEDHPADVDAPAVFAAIQESLGLKLEKHKGPVEMLVVDHIEKTPTEN
jgi:uncharacterized protein (TIGR03435 family)